MRCLLEHETNRLEILYALPFLANPAPDPSACSVKGLRSDERHTPAPLGADEKIVQRVLRHAKAHVTKDRYIKAFDPAVLAAMKRMETTLDAMKLCAPTVHQIN